jgi:hypothetical protein
VSCRFREAGADRADEFVAKGHLRSDVFAHRVRLLPKCGPDGFRLAERMCGIDDPAALWELVLYAAPDTLGEFPDELFFDDDIVWHQQQFGIPGQIASANLVVDGDTVYSNAHVSDVVQRIGRRREHKTRIEKRFGGWRRMLLNAILDFAQERGAHRVLTPTAPFALRNTDPARTVGPELFERIYDRAVTGLLPQAGREGEWWAIDLAQARDRIVALEACQEERPQPARTVCVFHDIERGLGHDDGEPGSDAQEHLGAMLELEARAGARATYCVVGALVGEVRADIESAGHSLAFHSYDHQIERGDQLQRCREVDYRLKGYRPPRSQLTAELSDRNLLHHNFEWIANSPTPLGTREPLLRAGVVRLPITMDDFSLHTGERTYEEWERDALDRIRAEPFTAIGLHDCYAPLWLDRYAGFLEQVGALAELRTLDEVAAEVTLATAA